MSLTKVTSGAVSGLATSATTDTTDASNITTGTIPTARLDSTLDLSGKTVTLPAASVTAHATNPTKSSIEALGIDASSLTGSLPAISGANLTGIETVTKASSNPLITTNGTLGDQWVNTTTGEMFILTDATTDANVWKGQNGSNVEPVEIVNFETALYTGTGGTQTINMTNLSGGVDFVWIKNRSVSSYNYIFDSIRGGTNYLTTTGTNAEDGTYASVVFGTSSFNITQEGGGNEVNASNGYGHVAWCASLPIDNAGNTTGGNGASKAYTNKSNGWMSVTTFAGNAATQHGIPHHLDAAPEFLWVKHRTNTGNHQAYSAALGNTKVFNINSETAPWVSSTRWDNTTPTATEVKLGTDWEVNINNDNYVMYAFTSVADKCKVGAYTGNAGANSINVGFEAQWILIRRTDAIGGCIIYDNARNNFGDRLYANRTQADYTDRVFNITTTGFDLFNGNGYANASGGTYIYLAIAKQL